MLFMICFRKFRNVVVFLSFRIIIIITIDFLPRNDYDFLWFILIENSLSILEYLIYFIFYL